MREGILLIFASAYSTQSSFSHLAAGGGGGQLCGMFRRQTGWETALRIGFFSFRGSTGLDSLERGCAAPLSFEDQAAH